MSGNTCDVPSAARNVLLVTCDVLSRATCSRATGEPEPRTASRELEAGS
jgi:hypothetical protein